MLAAVLDQRASERKPVVDGAATDASLHHVGFGLRDGVDRVGNGVRDDTHLVDAALVLDDAAAVLGHVERAVEFGADVVVVCPDLRHGLHPVGGVLVRSQGNRPHGRRLDYRDGDGVFHPLTRGVRTVVDHDDVGHTGLVAGETLQRRLSVGLGPGVEAGGLVRRSRPWPEGQRTFAWSIWLWHRGLPPSRQGSPVGRASSPERASDPQIQDRERRNEGFLAANDLAALVRNRVQPAVEVPWRGVGTDPRWVDTEYRRQPSLGRAEGNGDAVLDATGQTPDVTRSHHVAVAWGGDPESGVLTAECRRQVRTVDRPTDRLVDDLRPDRVSRRDPDGHALPLVHLVGGHEWDRVLQAAIDPNAPIRADLGHDSLSQRPRTLWSGAGPWHGAQRRQDTGVLQFVPLVPHLLSEVRGRGGVGQHRGDEPAVPVSLALGVGVDRHTVHPEHGRRTGDRAEFAGRGPRALGVPDERRRHEYVACHAEALPRRGTRL